jgi:hypothetical protein
MGWLRIVANLSLWTKPAVGADHVRSSLAASSSSSWSLLRCLRRRWRWRVGRAFLLRRGTTGRSYFAESDPGNALAGAVTQ